MRLCLTFLHHGLTGLGVPLPLGGSSNHFRTEVLREICGWDAWNVTEDADLGLRLTRFGYRSETVGSSTQEEAPARLKAWMTQRRRWSKGWMQTFITLSRDPARLIAEVGWARAGSLLLLMTALVISPLLWPLLTALMIYDLARVGLPPPTSIFALVETTLWLSGRALWSGLGGVGWLCLA